MTRLRALCSVGVGIVLLCGVAAADPPEQSSAVPQPAEEYDVPPKPVRATRPAYPPQALGRGIEGTVMLEVLIDDSGRPVRVRVTESIPELDKAAMECVFGWRFSPARKGGRAVRSTTTVPVAFQRDSVRTVGLTASAAADLRAVAALVTGGATLSVRRQADGTLVWSYLFTRRTPRSSGLRGALEDAQFDIWTGYLKQAADADGSDFVSTAEAHELKGRIELAYVLTQMAKVPTRAQLAEWLAEPVEQVTGDLAAYQKMRERAARDGMVGLPPLPPEFVDAV